MSDPMPHPLTPAAEMPWRCFHCDETLTDREQAAEHFGTHEHQSPACLIDAAEYRRMEALQARYADEDADVHRAMHRMEREHGEALRRAEEAGYAKGLRDYEAQAARIAALEGERDALMQEAQRSDTAGVSIAAKADAYLTIAREQRTRAEAAEAALAEARKSSEAVLADTLSVLGGVRQYVAGNHPVAEKIDTFLARLTPGARHAG
jgi:hypothetical protein